MPKQKKKRTKAYQGPGAAMARPSVTHVTAINRSRASQWWHDHKRVAKPALIAVAVIFIIVICVLEMIRLAQG